MYAVIAVAKSQVGYKEKATNSQLYDKTANAGDGNYTKYAHEFDTKYSGFYSGNKNGYAWCDMFVDWCFVKALGVETAKKVICQPSNSAGAGCTYSAGYYRNEGRFITNAIPKQGYQIFYKASTSGEYKHTGLVYKVDKNYVYTIEGNYGGGVSYRKVGVKSSEIGGYGIPKYEIMNGKTAQVFAQFSPDLELPANEETVGWTFPLNISDLSHSPTYEYGAYGWRIHPVYGDSRFHAGIDLSAASNTPIVAARDGKVERIYYSDGGGNTVELSHTVNGVKYKSRYLHMIEKTTEVSVNQQVTAGTIIGKVGSTGVSTGPHLHFEIHRNGSTVDPAEYIYNKQSSNLFLKTALTYDNFVPLYTSSTPTPLMEGNANSFFKRRGYILNDNESPILQHGKVDRLYYGGATPCGHQSFGTSSIASIVEKSAIENIIYNKSTGKFKTGGLSGDEQLTVATYIYNYLIDVGWTPNAICALLGNMVNESGLNPARWESNTDWSKKDPGRTGYINGEKYSRGFGLIQWTNWYKLWNWAEERGLDPYDIDTQLLRISGDYDYDRLSKTADYGVKCLNGIKACTNYTNKGPLYEYITTVTTESNYIFNLTKEEFTSSNLPIEVLTTAYLINAERPRDIYPDARITNALSFEEKLLDTMPQRLQAPDNKSPHWITKGKSVGGIRGVNPYPTVKNSMSVPNNNAYCWGRASEILSLLTNKKIDLCANTSQDWFDYALNTKVYDCGRVPRVGSIICWSYNKYKKGAKSLSKSYVGVVEQVLGNDSIVVSSMPHEVKSSDSLEDVFEYSMIRNTNSNWGLDQREYEFRGFIYLMEAEEINKNVSVTDVLKVKASSPRYSHTSLSIGINDMRHFNKAKLVYDLILTPPTESKASITAVKNHCNMYFHLSQRVDNYNGEEPEDCSTSYLPYTKDEYDSNEEHIKKTYYEGQFPLGVAFVLQGLPSELFTSKNYDKKTKTYRMQDVTNIVSLRRANVRGTYTDIFNDADFEGYDDKKTQLVRFNRQLQSYLGVTMVANAYETYPYSVEIIIKQIILYR
jgi:hypothetical protein